MKSIPVQKSVGNVLCHDITRIVPGEFKGRAFKRGHIVREEDVSTLRDLGKEHIYVFDMAEGLVHEDEAAVRIAKAAAGFGLTMSEPCEGRVNLHAAVDGLLKIDIRALQAVNDLEKVVLAVIHSNQVVARGRAVAGTRVIPLVVEEALLKNVEERCRLSEPLIQVKPFQPRKVGIVTTGSEVYNGRIKDKFGPILRKKFSSLNCNVLDQIFVPDNVDMTVDAIRELLGRGAEFIAVTGGMSVDPDDQTPTSIRAAGGRVVSYGAPTFPGAMFMLAHIGEVPVVGLPGCVMYAKASIFDLVVPRIIAGETLTRRDITALGHGGYCAGCEDCRYPVCGFGKGV